MSEPAALQGRLAGLSREQRALLFEELRKRKARAEEAPERIPRRPPDLEPLPLSFAQERLWFIDRLEPGLTAYNIPLALRIEGRLSPAVLAAILGEVVRRHEALRTTFREVEGRPAQVIAPAGRWILPLVDLSALPADSRAIEARVLAQEEADRPFDLGRGPLLRAALLRLGREEHALLLGMHHIVSDGWSMGVLVREITALYGAALAGGPSPLPELPIQYADFAVWQRGWLREEVLQRQLSYWREKLAGVPASLDLPADRPRPAVPTHRGARFRVPLDGELTRRLAALARRHEATPFMVLLAGFQALLARLTGQEDLTVGSPIANRNRAEIEPLIGFFVNTLVLRGDLAGDPAFGELLARVRRTTLEAYAHQDLPFEHLVEELRPQRHLAVNPLFQVLFALQNMPLGRVDLPGLSLAPLELEATSAQFDLELSLWETGDGILAEVAYSSELFDASTPRRLLAHLEGLLREVAADAGRRISEASLLSQVERHQLAVEWNDTGRAPADAGCLQDFVERQAARTPGAAAVEHGGEVLTYRDLVARARRLAAALRAAGVGPDVPVGLWVDRSLALPVSVLAVLQAGGACVPLDLSYPAERLALMIGDAGLRLVIGGSRALDDLPPGLLDGLELLAVDGRGELASALAPAAPPAAAALPAGPDHLAYVLYTSGSTGRPKGVALPHRALVNLVAWTCGLRPERGLRVLQFSPISFDVSFEEMFSTWASGGTLVLVPEELRRDPAALLRFLDEKRIERLFQPFVALQQLAEAARGRGGPPAALRELVTAGEQLRITEAVADLCRRGARLFNEYGPTETHVTTAHPLAGPPEGWPALPPIGRPVANHQVHLLDRNLRPVPAGVSGELCVGGAGLARGYLGRPELTAERFVPDPCGRLPGGRLYRTGDLARRTGRGEIEFLGRVDHQVKIRGYRVEPGEIEAAMAGRPGVRDAAVIVRQDPPGGRRLVAYVVWDGEGAEAELREALKASLPAFMVPAAFVALPALPLTPSGKLDRRALAGPRFAPAGAGAAPAGRAEPATATEREIAAIWREVLGADRVGAGDDFFDLGGHSLLAVQVLSRMRDRLGVDLPVRALFEAPTPAALARRADLARRQERPLPPPLERRGRREAPASFAQRRLWFLDRLDPGAPAHNLPFALHVRGELSPAVLAAALGEVVRRHEALRTTFEEREGEPAQVIAPPDRWELPVIDLAALPDGDRTAEARRLGAEMAAAPFDLARGPLFRARLVALGGGGHVLHLNLHHIVADGWSVGVLVREMTALYEALRAGRPSPLPELPVQYADFAVWQRRWLQAGELERQLSYWRGRLAGAPAQLELPADRPRPAQPTFRSVRVLTAFAPDLSRDLARFAQRREATLFMVLLAGLQALLRRVTGQEDIPVGSPVANRNRPEIEPLIGFFVNTLVLRGDLAGDPSFRELLARLRQTTLEAYAHQDLPFESLVEELRPERNLAVTPLFQVLCALQNAPAGALSLPGLSLEPVDLGAAPARFDLELSFWEEAGALHAVAHSSADLFDAPTVLRLISQLERLLREAAADDGRRLSELPLLSEPERAQLLREWNDTERHDLPDLLLHRLVEARAAADPEAVAVLSAAGDSLTYGELDARARRLARKLRDLGAGPDSRVVIAAGRSPDLIVGMLAVLLAGGAYVPVDPDYPAERIAFILEDSGAVALLAGERLRERGHLPGGPARVLALDGAGREGPALARGEEVDPAGAAYVIYTSGSTGRPKGVVVSHRSIAWHVRSKAEVYRLAPGARALQFSSLGFDASADEIWCPLVAGAALVLRSAEAAGSIPRFLDEVERLGITTLGLPTAFWRELAAALGEEGASLPATVRLAVIGGEEAQPHDLASWFRGAGRQVTLLNSYGPTEATISATFACLQEWNEGRPVPIGRPKHGARAYVVDRDLRLVPTGVWGELLIGGVGVARGYLGRPDLTAASFVPDAWSGEPGRRVYRSGDLVRFGADGRLQFGGRIDRQVKVRGFRIEPGEVEAALAAHPGLRAAAVVARPSPLGGSALLACVVPVDQGGSPGAAELRSFLAERLPAHLVPSAFAFLPRLPLTPNGKVDRRALERLQPAGESLFAPPRTPREELLAGLWREILGVERVGRSDSFFALGGHSLAATRLVSRLKAALGVEVPLRAVFETPTLAELAARLEPAAAAGVAREAAPAPAAWGEGMPAPLSFAQERLWFIDRLMPGSAAFNMPSPLLLRGPLDPGVLERAFREVRRRQGSLRTRFEEREGVPVQVVDPAGPWALPRIDLDALPDSRRRAEAERLAAEDAARPFDLARGPLFRPALVRLDREEHVLLLTCHHIVSDGWSTNVLIRELTEHYAAFAAGGPPPLPEPPVQYADLAARQRERLAGPALEAQLAYWRENLAGAPPLLDLPLDRPRPPVQTYRGEQAGLRLPADLAAALKSLSAAERASLYMTLLASLALLLQRWSGQEEVVVGSPVAGRQQRESEGLIGFFLNLLPMRVGLSGRASFRELLQRVRGTALQAYAYQDVPFERVLQELRLERETSYTPVFQVFLNMLNLPPAGGELPGGLSVEMLPLGRVEAKYDFTLYAAETGEGLFFSLVYNADLFERARMEELLRQLRCLLEQTVRDPGAPIDSFSLLTPEAAAVLPDPAAPLGDAGRGAVHELFFAAARRHPERAAVADPQGSWTYGELADAAGRLAAHLSAAGLERGDRVAVWAHRSAPVAWAVMGTLAAGGAFVMLDPAYPPARLVEILRLARPRAWLALAAAGEPPREVRELLAGWESEGRLLCRLVLPAGGPAAAQGLIASLPPAGEPVPAGPDDLAFVAFTSGSTGMPKGILGRHGPLSHFLPWQLERFGLTAADRYSLLSGLAHDPLQRDLFTPLCTGATLCAPDPEEVFLPGRLAAWAAEQGITVAHLTPALGQVLTEPPGDGAGPPSIPTLRWAFLVGDVLTRLDVDRLRRLAPGVTCVNLYGSTETQRAVGYHVADPRAGAAGQRARQVLPLGRGMDGAQLLVVNAAGRLAGVGEVGEIWVRSPHLARGYLGDEELTGERFRTNPFTGREADRVYRTGDLGRYLPDGEVAFAGRADEQVKIRGFRIEPGEIEAAIGRLEGVRDSVVVAREEGGERCLAAYVVAEPGAAPGLAGRLRPFLAARLPDYMVPAAFVELPALPLTPNGKVDRRALPAPRPRAAAAGAEPRTPVEEALAGLWAELLRRGRVGVHDDFFELGGHSLLATQMVARVRASLGVEIPLRALFERPTVAGLAERIEAAWRARETGLPEPPPLRPVPRGRALPLSFAQERLWFLAQIAPESAAYNMPAAVRLLGRLDRAALAAALAEIRRRHETLRTTFEVPGGEPVQVIHPAEPLPLPWIDLTALPPDAREAEARRLAEAEAGTPFDLARGPLVRARLLRLAGDEHALLWTTHHAVSDYWSVSAVLMRELAALYRAFAGGLPSPLPEPPIQYADFAVWQREWLRGRVLEEQVGYWRRQLAAASPLDLPADRPRRPVPSTRGASRSWSLPAEPAEALRRLARAEGATPFMALHAGFAALLHLYTGRTDVLVGTPVANRARTELEGLIGFFVNTLVLRADLAGDPGFREAVARSREAALGAYAHQDLPFEKLVDELGLPRDPYRPPLLRVLLQLRNVPFAGLEMPGLALAPFGTAAETAKFDLVVNLFEGADGFAGELRYDTDLFDAATVDRLSGRFAGLLAAWAADPGRPLSSLSALSEAERHQLLVEWNEGPAAADRERRCLHRRFEEVVDRMPDAPALAAGGERLTYRQLDERANRLARHLLASGVRPGDRVALGLERSAEMVVAILAVLKAGAAYVPLDPAYPAERRAFALEDSGASLLVTESLLDDQREEIEGRSGQRLAVPAEPDLPAYVIYTSGSTGRPKGVVVTHANVDRLLAATEPWFGFGPDDVWTLFHSYAFDFSVWELWGALLHGGRLVVVPYWESRSPEDFYRLLRDERVTVLNQTPSAFRQLLWAEESVLAGAPPERSPALALRWVVFGGEALEPASLAPWFARHGGERPRLVNMYGITETTVHVTFRPVRQEDLGRGSVIGGPIPDLSLHVLDAALRPQPIGVPGELHVGGAGLAQGYLGRPDLTAERFVPDPFSGAPGARLYRSGDLARRLPDGDLEYLGRIDHQVKIRGFRIELGEIEAALLSHPAVREAVVLARDDRHTAERRLVAYAVPAPGAAPDAAALREHLAARLPDYMLPSAFVLLDELPLTANGKVDRRALPAPEDAAAAPPARRREPPRTPLERFLAGRFRDVLGLPPEREVGLRDDFFELGGTSISGAILIHRLQEALGEIVHVVAIFDHPTVGSLADYVREQHAGAARRLWGEGAAEKGEASVTAGPAEVAEMDRLVAAGRPAPLPDTGEPPNPPAVFVLAPPRSGTTLLRVMLGAHPKLFAPPELELLSFQTLAERRAAFQGRDAFWLEGLIRAVMEARRVDAEEAERIVEERERQGWTSRRFYRELQEWLGGRLLVDKTPSYALDLEVLRRAEAGFAGARYIHLLRHPQATNRSFEEAKLDQIFFRRPHPFARRQLAELVWTVSHRNILGFLAGVPRERWTAVRFEELVREPDRVLSGVCAFLGLPYRPEMAEPYRAGVARMVDGPHRESRMLGDVKFLGHGRVDPAAADRWRQAGEAPLGGPAREIAKALGYAEAAPARGVLVPLQEGAPERRPLFLVHPVGGEVVAYRELARRLGPDQPVYGLQSPDPPLDDLRAMAARYLAAVREVQPEGPYRLAGWSMGGVVAYEMARQLEEQGEKAEVLALLDTLPPARWAGEPEPGGADLVALFAADLARLHGLEVPPVNLSSLDEDAALAAVLDLGRQAGLLPPDADPAELRRLFERFRANRRALAAYDPRPYAGEAHLFRAADRAARAGEPDSTLGWGELLNGRLRVSDLPGDHYTILREEVGTLAGRLQAMLG